MNIIQGWFKVTKMSKRGKKGKGKFEIPDQKENLAKAVENLSKYQIGEKGVNFFDVKRLKPIFAFDYLSFRGSNLCFDEDAKGKEDFVGFLKGLQKISGFTYEQMRKNPALRFHPIDFQDKRVTLKPKHFLEVLAPSGRGLTEEELPTLYQFDLQYMIEARAVGFLFKGVFYIVWYDRNHVIYPQRN